VVCFGNPYNGYVVTNYVYTCEVFHVVFNFYVYVTFLYFYFMLKRMCCTVHLKRFIMQLVVLNHCPDLTSIKKGWKS
jgi:hypothetical protein